MVILQRQTPVFGTTTRANMFQHVSAVKTQPVALNSSQPTASSNALTFPEQKETPKC